MLYCKETLKRIVPITLAQGGKYINRFSNDTSQRANDIYTTSHQRQCCIDVDATLSQRRVPAGLRAMNTHKCQKTIDVSSFLGHMS